MEALLSSGLDVHPRLTYKLSFRPRSLFLCSLFKLKMLVILPDGHGGSRDYCDLPGSARFSRTQAKDAVRHIGGMRLNFTASSRQQFIDAEQKLREPPELNRDSRVENVFIDSSMESLEQ